MKVLVRTALPLCSFLLLAIWPAAAFENVLGSVTEHVKFRSHSLEEVQVDVRIADIVSFEVDNYRFVDSLEITAELPREIATRGDITIAAMLYGSFESALPENGHVSTRAQRLHFQPFVDRDEIHLTVPVHDTEHSTGRMSVDLRPDVSDFPLALTFLPLGKGLPDDLLNRRIAVYIRPVSRGVGELVLNFRDHEGVQIDMEEMSEFELLIDSEKMNGTSHFVAPGFREILFESDHYRNRTIMVGVEEGVTSFTNIEIEPNPAELTFDAPRGTQVFLNGRILPNATGSTVEVPPGEHELRFVVGGQPIIRTIEVSAGERYTARINLDIEVFGIE